MLSVLEVHLTNNRVCVCLVYISGVRAWWNRRFADDQASRGSHTDWKERLCARDVRMRPTSSNVSTKNTR